MDYNDFKTNNITINTLIPNRYIKCNLEEEYALTKKLFVIMGIINIHKDRRNYSHICMSDVYNFYDYNMIPGRYKTKVFTEIIDTLKYMESPQSGHMIEIATDLSKITYTTRIDIKVCNLTYKKDFTMFNNNELDSIRQCSNNRIKDNLLAVLLYAKSYMYTSGNNAFWVKVGTIATELGICEQTVTRCLKVLSAPTDSKPSKISIPEQLLVKTKIYRLNDDGSTVPALLSNIYVLNDKDYRINVQNALDCLRGKYVAFCNGEMIKQTPNTATL